MMIGLLYFGNMTEWCLKRHPDKHIYISSLLIKVFRHSEIDALCYSDLQNTLIKQNIPRAQRLFPRSLPRVSHEDKPFFGMCRAGATYISWEPFPAHLECLLFVCHTSSLQYCLCDSFILSSVLINAFFLIVLAFCCQSITQFIDLFSCWWIFG